MVDTLRQLVNSRDRSLARPNALEPERLVLAPRHTSQQRICLECRRTPTYEAWRVWWLNKNPLPKRFCKSKWCSDQFKAKPEHRDYHESVWVSLGAPDMKRTPVCPFCGGRLIESSW